MMDNRENYLAFLNHENTDFVPCSILDSIMCGGAEETFENGPAGGGLDGFECNWIPTASAGGQGALDPFKIVLEDVCDWQDIVKFPDLDAFDWQALADTQLARGDRNTQVVEYHTWNSIFLRFTHLLGFENALCSLVEEPEASLDLINAIADYKCRLVDYVWKYFQPDSMCDYDDIATERMTFISPEVYREFFKPAHRKFNEAMLSYGIIPQRHTCGNCAHMMADYVDEGVAAWQAAQPMNDIVGLIQTMGDKISVNGGYDSNGRPGAFDVTDEEIRKEVIRCYDEYGQFGRGFAFMGFFLGAMDDPATQAKYNTLIGTVVELRQQGR